MYPFAFLVLSTVGSQYCREHAHCRDYRISGLIDIVPQCTSKQQNLDIKLHRVHIGLFCIAVSPELPPRSALAGKAPLLIVGDGRTRGAQATCLENSRYHDVRFCGKRHRHKQKLYVLCVSNRSKRINYTSRRELTSIDYI